MLSFVLLPIFPFVPYVVVALLVWWGGQWRARNREAYRRGLRVFAAEEVLAGAALSVLVTSQQYPWVPPAMGVGLALFAALGLGLPLPGWLPLRGVWLRRFLAAAALAALLAAGPWWWLTAGSWSLGSGTWGGPPELRWVYLVTAVTLPLSLALFSSTLWLWLAAPRPPRGAPSLPPQAQS